MICAENKLERFFARWEFTARHILCASDVDPFSARELLDLADEDSAARWAGLMLGYTESAGHPELRAAIAGLYTAISPDEVLVCGGGAAEALFLVSNALLDPGAHAIVVTPAFEPLYKVAAAAGAEVTQVPLDPAAGWGLDLGDIVRAVRPGTRLIAIHFPHHPTGVLLAADRFRELIGMA